MTTSLGTKARTVTTTHTVIIAAAPRAVYGLIADAARWPYLFSPVMHVERLAAGATEEQLRLWSVGNGATRSWTSRRALDPDNLRIRFRQERPASPVASMAGEWVFVPLPGNATSVVLLHEFRAIDDDPGNAALIKQAVDRNSTAELAAVKSIAELGDRLPKLVHSFSDSVTIGAPPGMVYDFLYRAQDWPRRMPNISRLVLDEAVPRVQTVEMDIDNADGSVHTMSLVRVCFPHHSIVYKQTRPSGLMAAHIGEWRLTPTPGGVRVTAHNTVLTRPELAHEMLSQPGAVERTGELILQSLHRYCRAILLRAKNAAETRLEQAG
jgi:aromatase